MSQLVTLAHRVSSIHARYSKIHDATLGMTGFKWRIKSRADGDAQYAGFEAQLNEMQTELGSIEVTLGSAPPEPNTSYSRKFVVVLRDYIQALSHSIQCLSEICGHRNRVDITQGSAGPESRAELTRYDQAIQVHKRLGVKLTRMVTRL